MNKEYQAFFKEEENRGKASESRTAVSFNKRKKGKPSESSLFYISISNDFSCMQTT